MNTLLCTLYYLLSFCQVKIVQIFYQVYWAGLGLLQETRTQTVAFHQPCFILEALLLLRIAFDTGQLFLELNREGVLQDTCPSIYNTFYCKNGTWGISPIHTLLRSLGLLSLATNICIANDWMKLEVAFQGTKLFLTLGMIRHMGALVVQITSPLCKTHHRRSPYSKYICIWVIQSGNNILVGLLFLVLLQLSELHAGK